MEPNDHDPGPGGDDDDGLADGGVAFPPPYPALSIDVRGHAEPHGSKVGMLIGWRPGQRHRPTIKLEESGNGERADGSSGNARAWRNQVREVAVKAIAAAPAGFPIDGPAKLRVKFMFERPKSHLRKSGGLVKGAPRFYASSHDVGDLSKLVRAIEDALADAGALTDDARISVIEAEKTYAAVGARAGCSIWLERLP